MGWIKNAIARREKNKPDFTVEKLPSTRKAMFFDLLKTRARVLIKINLLTVLFCLPMIAWLFFATIYKNGIGASIPMMSNLGFGTGLNVLAQGMYNQMILEANVLFFSTLTVGIIIACIGFAGAFHCMKLLVWGEGLAVGSSFFKGVKQNALQFIFAGLLLSMGIFVVVYNFDSYAIVGGQQWYNVLGIVTTVILLVILIFMTLFIFTQSATYKISFLGLLRNSFLFSIGAIIRNAFFIGLSLLPVFLMMFLSMMFAMFILMLYVFIGFSLTILIWTLYAHWIFDKFLNDKIEGAIKDRGIYRKNKEETEKKREEEKIRQEKARYVNPKKKTKKSVSEGKSYTPLEETFSRADLEKLKKEKAEVQKEIEEE